MLIFLLISCVISEDHNSFFDDDDFLDEEVIKINFNKIDIFPKNFFKFFTKFKSYFGINKFIRRRLFRKFMSGFKSNRKDFNKKFENFYDFIFEFLDKLDIDLLDLMNYGSNYKSIFEKIVSYLSGINENNFNDPIIEIFPEFQKVVDFINEKIIPNIDNIKMNHEKAKWIEDALKLLVKKSTSCNDIAKFIGIDKTKFLESIQEIIVQFKQAAEL